MKDALTSLLMLSGAAFMLLSAIGIVRMPDVYTRMHPAAKASTLGVGCMLVAVAVHFGTTSTSMRVIAGIAFVLLTSPVAAHMIGRAAYARGVPLWSGNKVDELGEHLATAQEEHTPTPSLNYPTEAEEESKML